jgi:RNA polymerase sigma-70 factor (ECF subfamily)
MSSRVPDARAPGRDDHPLLKSLSSGDESAFWTLWQQYQRHLYAVCLRHMSGDEAEADDAVSRSMMVARDRLPEHAQRIENLEAWLTRLTCNVCLDIHRERRRLGRGAVTIDGDAPAEPALMDTATPEAAYYSCEVRLVIAKAIAGLPVPLRDAADLRFIQETSYQIIAGRLGITVENARKRVQQARALLRQQIKRELAIDLPITEID